MSEILTVPHYQQLADGYCLPACVQMVLSYWGINREQADLAKELKMVPQAGTPGSRLKLLSSPDLDVVYQTGNLSDLEDALSAGTPPIVLVLFVPGRAKTFAIRLSMRLRFGESYWLQISHLSEDV